MPNTYGNYNEVFFAQEALGLLENALGLASRVHREFETETKEKGEYTKIRRPGTFVAQDAPSTPQDLDTQSIDLRLTEHKDVVFKLTDKDFSLTNEKIITDHIRPAVYALANKVDTTMATLIRRLPWYSQLSSTFDIQDLFNATQVLFDNGVPMEEDAIFGMVNGSLQAKMQGFLAGKNVSGAGVDEARRRGALGMLGGVNWFANQNTPSFATNTLTDGVGATTANALKGATTIAINGIDAAGTVVAGDTFSIAGTTQRFCVTANATASSGAIAALAFEPALPIAINSGAVVTFHTMAGTKTVNAVFHKNFAALKFAPLPDQMPGVNVATISDEDLGISVRAMMFYVPLEKTHYVSLDCLYGYTMLDHNRGSRLYSF